MTKLTENERKALNNACARLRETNLGTKIGNIEDFLDIDILKTDANTVSKAIDELFDKWANPLLNITVPPPGFFTLAGDAEGNLWCYCNDETNPPVFEHDETTGDLYLNIASEDGANSYQVHVGNYIAVKHLNDYYKKTEVDSKLGGKSNVGHNHDERYYTETEIDSKLNNKANTNHNHQDSNVSVTTSNYGSNLTQETFNSHISNDMILLKSKIDSLVGFIAKVVSELPATGENGVMYLKLNTSASVEGNIYDEYIWVNNKFEKIGSTETTVDLSGYVTQTEMNTQLANKANTNHNHDNKYSLLAHQHKGLDGIPDIICRGAGSQTSAGYRKVFQLKITKQYFDSPISFEFVQRNCRQTARVHIIFNSAAASTDPSLRNFTYEGAIEQPIYLHKESAGTWVFIIKEQSTYETVNVRFLPLSSSIKDSCTITPLNEFLSKLPDSNIQEGSMISATSTRTGYMDRMDKIKLDSIDDGANKTVVDSSLSSSSTNPVQNKVVNNALNGKSDIGHEHTSDDIHYALDQNVSVTTILENKAAKNHTHNYIPSTVSQNIFGSQNSQVTATRQGNVVTLRLHLVGEFLDTWKQWCTITDSKYLPDTDEDFMDFGITSSYGKHILLRINSDGRVRTAYGANATTSCYQTITFLKK